MSVSDRGLSRYFQPLEDHKPIHRYHKWPATIAVMLAMMTTIMASTMVNVAIADIMGAFGVGQDRVHWMSSGFLSATTVFMLLNAWFVYNLGPRNTLLLASLVFIVASIGGQIAPSFEGVVVSRIAQGACAGIVQPLALSVIFTVFPPNERGRAMGLFGVGVMMGPALGPLYGGLIIDLIDWRYVFGGPIPFILISAVLGSRYLPGKEVIGAKSPFNWLSLGLVSVAITSFLGAISSGPQHGWDSVTVMCWFILSIVSMLGFIELESRTSMPLLNVKLFRYRSFVVVAIVGFVFGTGMFGTFYLLPVFVRTVQGFTGTKAGIMLLMIDLIAFAVFPIAGWLSGRVSPVYTVGGGMLLFAISSLGLAKADVHTAFWFLVIWAMVGRIGLGLAIPAITATGMRDLSKELTVYGAGTMTFIRMLGGAMGVSCLAVLLDLRANKYLLSFQTTQVKIDGETGVVLREIGNRVAIDGVESVSQLPVAYAHLNEMLVAQAYVEAFQDGYLILSVLFVLAAICALTLHTRPAV